ncbi:sensor histidine kinase [Pseudodesulfovibrio tunisiensis]|uniref:sensor histidine kinase n=1 Tax=Pseudodesulfovibrio tunisiensis TaxID=463192 RepID=UPI001FB3EB3B|nr:ATP-binding protein [Pseudodesulfovibrio tunisiensis]
MLRAKGTRIVDNLNILILEGERLTRLIGDVLDLNKIESGRVEWRDQRIAPGAIAGNAVDAVSGQFAQNPDVELVLDVEPGLPEIEVDPDRLFQVLLNLLNNAAKFTAAGRVILSVSAASPEMVRFAVSDTGPGLPESELERVFETFHQAVAPDDLSCKPGGAGLGLAISREIVQHYQGRIWVESELGKGSVFLFELSAVS